MLGLRLENSTTQAQASRSIESDDARSSSVINSAYQPACRPMAGAADDLPCSQHPVVSAWLRVQGGLFIVHMSTP